MIPTFDDSMARVAATVRRFSKDENPDPEVWIGKVTSTTPPVVQLGTFTLSAGDGSLVLSHCICISCPNDKLAVCPRALRAGDRAVLVSRDQQTYYMVGKF